MIIRIMNIQPIMHGSIMQYVSLLMIAGALNFLRNRCRALLDSHDGFRKSHR